MKKAFLVISLSLTSLILFSQEEAEYTQEAGKVTKHEMLMTEYSADKNAEALVIYELGEYFFRNEEYGFSLNMYISKKIKILNQAGLKYANIEIPYYLGGEGPESIYDIDCTTFNYIDNKLTKTQLQTSSIFEEKINDRWKSKKFAMPDVREGSVIEIRYKISTPYFFNMRTWEFQQEIPVIYSKLNYRAIPYYEYTFILKGAKRFDEYNSKILPVKNPHYAANNNYQEVEYNFGMKNLSAFKDQEFITSKKDYMVAVDFQISKTYSFNGAPKEYMLTWPKLNDELLKEDRFGKYIKGCEKEAKSILPGINLTNKDQIQQLEEITNYVKENYNWDEYRGKYASQKASNFIKTKSGNIADINLFLIGLLKAANINASPVILSTRSNGTISKGHPFLHFFDYVIAMVEIDDKKYFIDATAPLLSNKELPTRCVNVMGLVVKPKTEEWIFTEQKNIKETDKRFNIKISPEDYSMDVATEFIANGNDAYSYRIIYNNSIENLSNYIQKRWQITSVKDVEVKENLDMSQPFEFSFNYTNKVGGNENKLFIQPFGGLSISENPFKQNKRSLTIDLIYISGDRYKSTIEIPEGYKVEYLPKDMKYDNQYMTINYSAKEQDGKVIIDASYLCQSNMYAAEAYIPLKVSMGEIIKHFSDMVILVKK